MRILKKVKDSGQVSIYVLGIKLISYKKKIRWIICIIH